MRLQAPTRGFTWRVISEARLDKLLHRCWIEYALRIGQLRRTDVLARAIDNKHRTRDERGGVTEEENRCISNVHFVAKAADWDKSACTARAYKCF